MVFGFYDNFVGNTLNPIWTQFNGGSGGSTAAYTTQNGLDVHVLTSGSSSDVGLYASYNSPSAGTVAEVLLRPMNSLSISTTRLGLGHQTVPTSKAITYGYIGTVGAASNVDLALQRSSAGTVSNLALISDVLTAGNYYTDQLQVTTGNVMATNLGDGKTSGLHSDSTYTLASIGQIVLETGGAVGNEYFYNWIRARAFPPGGVMPSASLGTLVPAA
jgi:hypothetical protein